MGFCITAGTRARVYIIRADLHARSKAVRRRRRAYYTVLPAGEGRNRTLMLYKPVRQIQTNARGSVLYLGVRALDSNRSRIFAFRFEDFL